MSEEKKVTPIKDQHQGEDQTAKMAAWAHHKLQQTPIQGAEAESMLAVLRWLEGLASGAK